MSPLLPGPWLPPSFQGLGFFVSGLTLIPRASPMPGYEKNNADLNPSKCLSHSSARFDKNCLTKAQSRKITLSW